jgi:hypothetical protein
MHARDSRRSRPRRPRTGNLNRDRKYQQLHEKLYAKQNQERQKLQQRQEQEDQRFAAAD